MKKKLPVFAIFAAICISTSISAQTFSYVELSPDKGFPSNTSCIHVEERGLVWICSEDGLYTMLSSNYVTAHTAANWNLPSNNVRKVTSDSKGYIWILTDKGFIGYKSMLIEEKHETISCPDEGAMAYSVLPGTDMVYFGGENRILAYSHTTGEFSTEVSFSTNVPYPITDMLSVSGNKWNDIVLLSRGASTFFIYNAATKEIRESESRLNDAIITGFADSEGELWLSLYRGGVIKMSQTGDILARYNTSNSDLSSDDVLCFEERNGKIWMGTEGGGINILDPQTGQIICSDFDAAGSFYIPTSTVPTMFCDHNGHMWCGRKSGGAFVVVESDIRTILTSEITPAISPDGISCLFNDGDGTVWTGTAGSGLLKYNAEKRDFTSYPETAGLYIFSIAALDSGHLVLSCPDQGGFLFDKANGSIRKLSDVSNVFPPDICLDESYLVNDSRGRLMIAGTSLRRWDRRADILEAVEAPDGVEFEGDIQPVSGSNGEYFIDHTHIFGSDASDSHRLTLLYTMEEGTTLDCGSIGGDGTIWVADKEHLYRHDLSTGTTSEVFTFNDDIMCLTLGSRDRLLAGTRGKMVCIDPQACTYIILTDVDGVRVEDFKQNAATMASSGDFLLGGGSGLAIVHPSFSFGSAAGLDIKMTSLIVDGEVIRNPKEYLISGAHTGIDFNFTSRSSDILKSETYHVTLNGPEGLEFDQTTDQPHIHFTKMVPGVHTLSISATDFDGNWNDSRTIYTFRIKKMWYSQWWSISLLILLLLGATTLFLLRHYKNKDEEKDLQISNERYNFLVNISHELRTPLTLISGPLRRYIKLHPELDEQSKSTISKVCLQADRMTNLLNTILTTNKIHEGADKVTPVATKFNDWLFKCVDQFYDEANGLKMDILFFPDSSVGVVNMDEHMCSIVLSNIISNALKHNEPGTPLTVWNEWNESNGTVRVNVKDHGCGIGQVDVSKLFERYYQATEEHTGFGIGLSYAKTIIDAHHGNIGAYNNINDKGATFWFELPADRKSHLTETDDISAKSFTSLVSEMRLIEENAVAAASGSPQGAAHEHKVHKPLIMKTILFVDDDKDLRDYVSEELSQYCGKVLLAVNGRDALDVLKNNEVDSVISDVMMPEIDGLELCRRIKSNASLSHIPVILLTARTDEKTVTEGKKAMADHYMPKPFNTVHLLEVLRSN